MKIWILTSETPFNQPGGIARYVDNFARYLGSIGHSVTVICRDLKDSESTIAQGYRLITFRTREKDIGLPCDSREPDQHPSYPYNILYYWMAAAWDYAAVVERLVASEGAPDVIESQEYMGIAYFILHKKYLYKEFLAGVPVVLNLHSPDFILRRVNQDPRWQIPTYWSGQMEKYCIFAADSLICPSAYLAKQTVELLEDPSLNIEVHPLPWPDTSSLPAATVEQDLVVYFGRIELRKGVMELLHECERLWASGKSFRLRMIGSDTQYGVREASMTELLSKKYAHRIASGQLEFTGGMEHRLLLQEISKAAVVVIPSIWENYANTCMEALALGKVVVASTAGGQVEMIGHDEAAGFLFDWKTPGAFSQALERALALSPAERAKIGETAKARIAERSAPDVVLQKRLLHFESVIARAKSSQSAPRLYPFVNTPQRKGEVTPIPAELKGEKGLVSAIIPFYNLGPYVEESLDSVLASKYDRLEVIIVNDGSTDPASLEVLERIRARHLPNVRILDVPNGGLSRARNIGTREARGEFLLLCDADDLVTPHLVPKAVSLLQRYPNVHWVYPWVRYFGEITGIFSTWNAELPYMLAHNMLIPICMVRRGAYHAFGQNKPEMLFGLEDYEAWLSLMENGCGGLSIPEVLALYRVRKESMFRAITPAQMNHLYDVIVESHPKLYRQYGPDLFMLQTANGPGYIWEQPAAFQAPLNILYEKAAKFDQKMATMEVDLLWNMNEVKILRQRVEKLRADLEKAATEKAELSSKLQTTEKHLNWNMNEVKHLNEQLSKLKHTNAQS